MASFTTQIKDEVTKIETTKLESLAEVVSYIKYNAIITDKAIKAILKFFFIKISLIVFI